MFGQDFGVSAPGTWDGINYQQQIVDEATGFAKEQYEELLALAGDKPIACGEVGAVPSPEILAQQPRWAWFMAWGEPGGNFRQFGQYRALYASEQALTFDELPWVTVKEPTIHYPVLK